MSTTTTHLEGGLDDVGHHQLVLGVEGLLAAVQQLGDKPGQVSRVWSTRIRHPALLLAAGGQPSWLSMYPVRPRSSHPNGVEAAAHLHRLGLQEQTLEQLLVQEIGRLGLDARGGE